MNPEDSVLVARLKQTYVKSISAIDYLHTKGEKPDKGNRIRTLHFNENGKLVKEVEYESNEALLTKQYEYGEHGVVKEITFKDSAQLLTTKSIKYDENGKVSLIIIQGTSGNDRYREERKYDKFGYLKKLIKSPFSLNSFINQII